MNKKCTLLLASAILGISSYAIAANFNLSYLGASTGGYNGTSIHKYYDKDDGVICYVYSPDIVTSSNVNGQKHFTANNAGSISCVKK
jgi:hypothetical protein